tara:strand:- start:408 stop:695 length:288 start_codon:yes stop_codon:yes gene_type:complete
LQVDLNLKTLGLISSIIVALIGNVFVVGQFYQSQQVHMEKMMVLEKKVEDISNLYDVKASILNLENKLVQLEFFLGMTNPNSCDNPANAGRMDCK